MLISDKRQKINYALMCQKNVYLILSLALSRKSATSKRAQLAKNKA